MIENFQLSLWKFLLVSKFVAISADWYAIDGAEIVGQRAKSSFKGRVNSFHSGTGTVFLPILRWHKEIYICRAYVNSTTIDCEPKVLKTRQKFPEKMEFKWNGSIQKRTHVRFGVMNDWLEFKKRKYCDEKHKWMVSYLEGAFAINETFVDDIFNCPERYKSGWDIQVLYKYSFIPISLELRVFWTRMESILSIQASEQHDPCSLSAQFHFDKQIPETEYNSFPLHSYKSHLVRAMSLRYRLQSFESASLILMRK